MRTDSVNRSKILDVARGYFSISTQFENVGDALINRELMRLASDLMPVYIDISRCPTDFVKTIGAKDFRSAVIMTSSLRMFLSMVRSRFCGLQPYYFLNPGGIFGEMSSGALFSARVKLFVIWILARLGIRVCHVGVSYERIGPRHARFLEARSKLLHAHLVRDQASARYALAKGLRVDGTIPDLAFGAASDTVRKPRERRFLGISFRLDQAREEEDLVIQLIQQLDERLPQSIAFKFVSQVRRDEAGLQRLAGIVKRRQTMFCEVSSSIQACEEAYSDCSYVLANRLHALLIGAIAGASPVGAVTMASNSKIAGLFDDLEIADCLFDLLSKQSADHISTYIAGGKSCNIDLQRERLRLIHAFSSIL